MSAYICSPEHIGALAAYVLTQRYPNVVNSLAGANKKETTANIARCLMLQNIRSVAERYPNDSDGNRPGPIGFFDADLVEVAVASAQAYLISAPKLSALDIIAMANGYDYQACETEDYDKTPAADQIRKTIHCAIRNIPGYAAAVRDFTENRFDKTAA